MVTEEKEKRTVYIISRRIRDIEIECRSDHTISQEVKSSLLAIRNELLMHDSMKRMGEIVNEKNYQEILAPLIRHFTLLCNGNNNLEPFWRVVEFIEDGWKHGALTHELKEIEAQRKKNASLKPYYPTIPQPRPFLKSLLGHETAMEWLYLGTQYLKKRYLMRASHCFNKCIALNPKIAIAYVGLGMCSNDVDVAMKYFSKSIEIEPRCWQGHYNRGCIKQELNDFHGALNDYIRCLRINPSFPKAYHNRSELLKKLGMPNEAEEDRNKFQEYAGDWEFECYLKE